MKIKLRNDKIMPHTEGLVADIGFNPAEIIS